MKRNKQKIMINCLIVMLVMVAAGYCIWYIKSHREEFVRVQEVSGMVWQSEEEQLSHNTVDDEKQDRLSEGFLTIGIEIEMEQGMEQKVAAWNDGNTIYAFIPSCAKAEEYSFYYDENEYRLDLDDKPLKIGEKVDIEFGKSYTLAVTYTDIDGQEQRDDYTFKAVCSENLPAIFIQTESGGMEYLNQDKENKEAGTLVCIDSYGNIEYAGNLSKISGRGNSSWEEDKKSYGITLEEECGLVGMEKDDKWILQANALDASRMRNKITYDIASEMGVDYAVDSEYVDVYFNGEYAGNYLLCEKIEVGEGRVEITDLEKSNEANQVNDLADYHYIETESGAYYALETEPDDVSGGYLLEFNDRLSDKEDRTESFFRVQDKVIEVKSPKYLSEKEYEYISDFMVQVDESLRRATESNDYQSYIDENSWSLVFLLNELSNDTDANRYSVFYYKDKDSVNSKLCAGPVWDYDIAWGNDFRGYDYTCSFFRMGWYNELYDNEEFYARVVESYRTKMLPILQRYVETDIVQIQDYISASVAMDDIRWQKAAGYGRRSPYSGYEEAVTYLKWYVRKRSEFFADVWLSGEVYHRAFFQNGDTIEAVTYVKEGETIDDGLLDYIADTLSVGGWRYANGNSFATGIPVIQDIVLYATPKPAENVTEIVDNSVEVVDNNKEGRQRLLIAAFFVILIVILWNLYIMCSFIQIKKNIKKENGR